MLKKAIAELRTIIKGNCGHGARVALLAYAFLRNRPRWVQEAAAPDLAKFYGYGLYREVVFQIEAVGIPRATILDGRQGSVEADLKTWMAEPMPEAIAAERRKLAAEAMATARAAREAHRLAQARCA